MAYCSTCLCTRKTCTSRIWRVLSSQIKNHIDPQPTSQNSPYRRIIKPFEFIIDRFAPQEYTPDEITEYGTQLVNDGVQKLYDFHGGQGKKLSGYKELLKGYLMDIVDGVRARNSPHLKTEQGYLLDVLADQ
jgi:hypothetical protein